MTEQTTRMIELCSQLPRIQQRLDMELQNRERGKKRMADTEADVAEATKALGLIDQTIATVSANGVGKIETTVTQGLRLVFEDDTLSFKVQKKNGKRGNSYYMEVQQGEHSGTVQDTFGGGVVNVVSFLLRILIGKRFNLAKVIFGDEMFNNVSAKHLPKVSEMLHSLAHDSGYTILVVTHQPLLTAAADHAYRVEQRSGWKSPRLIPVNPDEIREEIDERLASRIQPAEESAA